MPGPLVPWLVVLGLSLGPAVSNGLARFAYGLILPAMQADLGWTYAQAGWLNTANAAGYLVGALATFALVDRLGARGVFAAGMAVTPLALAGSAASADLVLQSAFRIAAGVAGAGAFIAGGALAAATFRDAPARNALAIGLYFGGGGLGMIASGATLPILFDRAGAEAWPAAWLLLAGLAALAAGPALWAAARCPRAATGPAGAAVPLPLAAMAAAIAGYALFAVGYIVYVTFLVALMREGGAGPTLVATCWTILGLGVMAAPFLWRGVLARSAGGGALALACLATGAATLLPVALAGALPALLASVALFGLSFFMAPTAVTRFARRNLDQGAWGRAVALFTTVFAAGQIVGPVLAGLVADATGSVSRGMAAAGAALLAGAATAALQRPLARTQPRVAG
jgi:predicted MFS family arabinose efflux permease